jgi:hypothetical protein
MQFDSRKSHVARIGRTYPRPLPSSSDSAATSPRAPRYYRIAAGLITVLCALGLIGWWHGR